MATMEEVYGDDIYSMSEHAEDVEDDDVDVQGIEVVRWYMRKQEDDVVAEEINMYE